jgi:hemoglobin-like flavoprotein
MFKGDMKEQGRKLMSILNTAVNALNNVEAIVPALQTMGKRHVDYGVKDKDYDTVGEALIWTLGAGLKDDFTEDTKAAWIAVYGLVAGTMKEAAAELAA